jgi:hypothetical protein
LVVWFGILFFIFILKRLKFDWICKKFERVKPYKVHAIANVCFF